MAAQIFPKMFNSKKTMTEHITIQLLKIKYKEKILEAVRER